ncbi:DUF1885 family protein [Cytobacillus spongiae]|jgi:hypothetical protein|uniref:DUF1885 family protein n=1 Tax=Cytobacillus spongiae TaxID=2901381 RepID=UPI001F1D5BF2|nr:DUF1885 family protein [Cytobacillus spongiae]UII57251.1 DUF1885 family protein [Cytobacillus spongiae]
MASNAYIKLVPLSAKESVTTDEVKELFHYYKEITTKTGEQVSWHYNEAAFPYELKETNEGKGTWFYMSSDNDRYQVILLGIDQETIQDDDGSERKQTYIQITLPETATFGDKGKANEFAKYLAKKLKGELHLFNGRVMYYYPRK